MYSMSISHTVWSIDEKKPLETASLIDEKELELLLRDNIEILNKGWLVISNQVKTDAGGDQAHHRRSVGAGNQGKEQTKEAQHPGKDEQDLMHGFYKMMNSH